MPLRAVASSETYLRKSLAVKHVGGAMLLDTSSNNDSAR